MSTGMRTFFLNKCKRLISRRTFQDCVDEDNRYAAIIQFFWQRTEPICIEGISANLLKDIFYRYLIFAVIVFVVIFNLLINKTEVLAVKTNADLPEQLALTLEVPGSIMPKSTYG